MKAVATNFRRCACGSEVALVYSERTGKLYSVEIGDDGIVTTNGPKTASVDTADFHRCAWYPGLAEFIRRAIQRGARRLRMRLLAEGDLPVLLKWEPKWPNLAFLSDGQPRYESTSYGKLDLNDGGFQAGDCEVPSEVLNLLGAVSDNPMEAVAAYGRATRICTFCDRDLDDERSTEVGYGPNCARHFGLPWGDEGENSKKRARRTRKAVTHE
jgi:hypothetical protein